MQTMMNNTWMTMAGYGWFGLICLVVLLLAAAALVKYLVFRN